LLSLPTQSRPFALVIHKFTGSAQWVKGPHINKDSSPLSVFMLFFLEIMRLLLEETNRYYHQYLDTLEEGRFPLPDVTIQEMYYCYADGSLLNIQTQRLLVHTRTVFYGLFMEIQ
jgi:hypothetical protein